MSHGTHLLSVRVVAGLILIVRVGQAEAQAGLAAGSATQRCLLLPPGPATTGISVKRLVKSSMVLVLLCRRAPSRSHTSDCHHATKYIEQIRHGTCMMQDLLSVRVVAGLILIARVGQAQARRGLQQGIQIEVLSRFLQVLMLKGAEQASMSGSWSRAR